MALHAPTPQTLTVLMLLPFVVWRVQRRFKRLVGRQHLTAARPWVTLAIFAVVLGLLVPPALADAARWPWLAGGLVTGVVLGLTGLRRTRFEVTPEGLYYTPSLHLGILLTLLVVGRVLWRLVQIAAQPEALAGGHMTFVHSPATLGVFGLMAGYYVTYAVGLLRWRAGLRACAPAAGVGGAAPNVRDDVDGTR